MNKNDLILKAIWIPLYFIIFFGIKTYKQAYPKIPEMISALDIKEGEFNVISSDQIICGNIKIEKGANNGIIINLKGDEIQGENIVHKKYRLKPVNYFNFHLKPITTNHETYYMYDTGESYVILLKIRKENFYFVSNYDKKKTVDLYLICEVNYEVYDYMIDYSYKRELQEDVCVSIDTNRYTCFFEQENIEESKKHTFDFLRKSK